LNLAVSLVVAVMFGSGAFLVLQRDLFRVVVGIVLISNSASLFIIAAGLTRGSTPILPLPEGSTASDPLVQAMAITAIVITSSVAALLLSLIYRLYVSHDTVDITSISEAEAREAEALERKGGPEEEEESREGPGEEELEERMQ
jgi:multicomponent Na+:H+ antiporter subunit C